MFVTNNFFNNFLVRLLFVSLLFFQGLFISAVDVNFVPTLVQVRDLARAKQSDAILNEARKYSFASDLCDSVSVTHKLSPASETRLFNSVCSIFDDYYSFEKVLHVANNRNPDDLVVIFFAKLAGEGRLDLVSQVRKLITDGTSAKHNLFLRKKDRGWKDQASDLGMKVAIEQLDRCVGRAIAPEIQRPVALGGRRRPPVVKKPVALEVSAPRSAAQIPSDIAFLDISSVPTPETQMLARALAESLKPEFMPALPSRSQASRFGKHVANRPEIGRPKGRQQPARTLECCLARDYVSMNVPQCSSFQEQTKMQGPFGLFEDANGCRNRECCCALQKHSKPGPLVSGSSDAPANHNGEEPEYCIIGFDDAGKNVFGQNPLYKRRNNYSTGENTKRIQKDWEAYKQLPLSQSRIILDNLHAKYVAKSRCVAKSSNFMKFFTRNQICEPYVMYSPSQWMWTRGNGCACYALANALSATDQKGYNLFVAEDYALRLLSSIPEETLKKPESDANDQVDVDEVVNFANKKEGLSWVKTQLNDSSRTIVVSRVGVGVVRGQAYPSAFLKIIAFTRQAPSSQKAIDSNNHLNIILKDVFSDNIAGDLYNFNILACEDGRDVDACLNASVDKWLNLFTSGKGVVIVNRIDHWQVLDINFQRDPGVILRNSLEPFNRIVPQEFRALVKSIRDIHESIVNSHLLRSVALR